MPPPLVGEALAFRDVFQQTQISFIENDTSLPRAPLPGELARQRLRGWTKDAFRLSGITQVLLCTTSPTSSLRSMPPPLVGEALAFRDVFQQTQIGFIENETSLPKAPLIEKTPPAGGGGTQVPKGDSGIERSEDDGEVVQSSTCVIPLNLKASFVQPLSLASARQLPWQGSPWQRGFVFDETDLRLLENVTECQSLPY